MPTNRKVVFGNGEYYHVFNRGVEKRPTFMNKYDFARTVDSVNFYRFANLPMRYSKYLSLSKEKKAEFLQSLDENQLQVEIISYCLMGNHFHFLLKQVKENGIFKFMAKFTNSYTKYFNTKYERVGPLFQGIFKAVHVEDDEQLLHLSRYIHLNPVVGFRVEIDKLAHYEWSSYPAYLEKDNKNWVHRDEILNFFNNPNEYEKFVLDQADYVTQLSKIEHLALD